MHKNGFTLIELMVVVVIVAIFATIAIPSYQTYIRRADASKAQQELKRIATLLERHKARNFSYKGFSLSSNPTVLPVGAADSAIKYSITFNGATSGQSWVIRADSTDAQNYSYLMTSTGLLCKNKTKANIIATSVSDATCGTGSEPW